MEHPITPPLELVEELQDLGNLDAIQLAYRAGADAELEACCEWMEKHFHGMKEWGADLRAARRPKPPSLAEKALEVVTSLRLGECVHRNGAEMDVLTAALERLKELEKGNE